MDTNVQLWVKIRANARGHTHVHTHTQTHTTHAHTHSRTHTYTHTHTHTHTQNQNADIRHLLDSLVSALAVFATAIRSRLSLHPCTCAISLCIYLSTFCRFGAQAPKHRSPNNSQPSSHSLLFNVTIHYPRPLCAQISLSVSGSLYFSLSLKRQFSN